MITPYSSRMRLNSTYHTIKNKTLDNSFDSLYHQQKEMQFKGTKDCFSTVIPPQSGRVLLRKSFLSQN